jgi:hypothetical protein
MDMTKEAAMTEYRAAREFSYRVCEAALAGKATDDECYAARRAYTEAWKKCEEMEAQ